MKEPKSSTSKRAKVTLLGETYGVSTLSEEYSADNPSPVVECSECDKCFPELDAMSNHVSTEHGEKDKCKSTADNVVTTQSSGVEYVNELEEENINLKEENIKLKEQVKKLEENL